MKALTDVFVVGGGPVGLAAAIALSRKGLEVTVADGAKPPIDKACGEGLLPDTIDALRALDVEVNEGDGYAFRGIRFIEGNQQIEAGFPCGHGIGVRRTKLHQKLIQRATECGICLHWSAPVTWTHGNCVSVKGNVVQAKWIVGADGSDSRVRKWAGLEANRRKERRFAVRRHLRVSPWTDCVEVYWGCRMQAYVTAVSNEEVCVAVLSREPRMTLEAALSEFPGLAKRLAGAKATSTDRGGVTAMHSLRRVHRGCVALIGDASGGVDAITGDGLCLGFRQAEALARALQAGDLATYETEHRRLAWRPHLMGRLLLTLDRQVTLRRRILRALSSDPDIFKQLLELHVGEVSPSRLAATGALLCWRFLAA